MLGIIPLPFGKPQPQSRRARPAPAPRPDRPAAVRSTAMASSPQKSPSVPKSPTPKSPPSRKKDDSFLGKLGGTLARRKKAKEGEWGRAAGAAGAGVRGVGAPAWRGRAAGARRREGRGDACARFPGSSWRARRAPPVCAIVLRRSHRRCAPGPGGARVEQPGPESRQRPLWARAGAAWPEGPGWPARQPGGGVRLHVGPRSPPSRRPNAGISQVSAETFLGVFTLTFYLSLVFEIRLFVEVQMQRWPLWILPISRAQWGSLNQEVKIKCLLNE